MKTQITKCYLVQILDSAGNEIACEYVCGSKEQAAAAAKRIKEEIKDKTKK